MKNYLGVLSTFLILTGYLNAQEVSKDSLIILKGEVINEQNEAIPFANIVNIKNYKGTITDTIGLFNFITSNPDTILISSLGYEDKYMDVTDSNVIKTELKIVLKSKVYELAGVTKYQLKRYEQFKQDFLNLKLQGANPMAYRGLPKSNYKKPELELPPVRLTSPLTMIHRWTSDEAREIRMAMAFRENQKENATIYSVIKKEKIEEITGFIGDKLDKFIIYCNFPKRLQSKDDEYTIINKIIECLTEFEESLE